MAPQDTKQTDTLEHRYTPERKKRTTHAKVQPPLTPMIDVTFQLLLYFLLTSTFREDEGQIPGSLPATVVSNSPTIPIKITVRPVGEMDVDAVYEVRVGDDAGVGGIADAKELYTILERERDRTGEKTPVQIQPSGYVRWQYVVQSFNAALRAKFEIIAFSTAS